MDYVHFLTYSMAGHQESKLEPSEELGDLFKGAGDAETALACYQTAGSTTKVVEGACMQCFAK